VILCVYPFFCRTPTCETDTYTESDVSKTTFARAAEKTRGQQHWTQTDGSRRISSDRALLDERRRPCRYLGLPLLTTAATQDCRGRRERNGDRSSTSVYRWRLDAIPGIQKCCCRMCHARRMTAATPRINQKRSPKKPKHVPCHVLAADDENKRCVIWRQFVA